MFSKILVALDVEDSSSWERSLPVAVSLARCFSARLTLCSVLGEEEVALEAQRSPIAFREMLDSKRAKLELIARDVSFERIDIEVGVGSVVGGILHLAEETSDADLIVIQSHHPALRDHFLAGTAIRVARKAACSVLVVRSEGHGDPANA
jgi:nucleotide-binding universal stress UspA family protein